MYYFLQSELLSRRLAHFCCKRISNIFNEYSNCFFEKTFKKLQTKSSSSSDLSKALSLPKSATSANLLTMMSLPQSPINLNQQQQQQQQKSPDLINPNSANSTKLKPFVTNLNNAPTSQLKNLTSANPIVTPLTSSVIAATTGPTEAINYVLKKDVSIKSV